MARCERHDCKPHPPTSQHVARCARRSVVTLLTPNKNINDLRWGIGRSRGGRTCNHSANHRRGNCDPVLTHRVKIVTRPPVQKNDRIGSFIRRDRGKNREGCGAVNLFATSGGKIGQRFLAHVCEEAQVPHRRSQTSAQTLFVLLRLEETDPRSIGHVKLKKICRINHIIQNTCKITRRHRVQLASPQVPNERACFSQRACLLDQYGTGTFQSGRHRARAIDQQASGLGKIRQESQRHFVMDSIRPARQIQIPTGAIFQVACRANESLAVALR